MSARSLIRIATAAALFSAIPIASVSSMAQMPVSDATAPTAAQAQRLAHLKTKGAAEIDRRLASLNAALAKLTAGTKLDAASKAALTKQVQDETSGLAAIKTKLAAETTLAGARADVAGIVSDYRVYALLLPKVRLIAGGNSAAAAIDKFTPLAGKLQDRISARKAAGQDAAAMQASLDDLNAKKADAVKQIGRFNSLLPLQPADYNANHALLVSYRDALETAQSDLKTARDDAKSIIGSLQAGT